MTLSSDQLIALLALLATWIGLFGGLAKIMMNVGQLTQKVDTMATVVNEIQPNVAAIKVTLATIPHHDSRLKSLESRTDGLSDGHHRLHTTITRLEAVMAVDAAATRRVTAADHD